MARILMIEDDAALAGLVRDYLKPFGYEVVAAGTAAEGLNRLRERWAAVLLDVMLPDVDGFEVCRRIRAGSDVPVLMLTARGQDEDRIVGLEIGADDYLPKPFNPRELLARLRPCCGGGRPVPRRPTSSASAGSRSIATRAWSASTARSAR
jgi:DNA-binding response OmpR family regulator